MKLSDVQIKDLITIVNETIELLNILKRKIDLGFIKEEKVLNSYETLYNLISLLDNEREEYNEMLIRISNEVRLLLKTLRNMTFRITDYQLINQYYKLFELLRWWDFILHYWDERQTLPPKYDYKPKQL